MGLMVVFFGGGGQKHGGIIDVLHGVTKKRAMVLLCMPSRTNCVNVQAPLSTISQRVGNIR
jgi:hypothetical protein